MKRIAGVTLSHHDLDNRDMTERSTDPESIRDAVTRSATSRAEPVTLRDVARVAAVHPSTASRALNGGPRPINTATAARVKAAAEQLGYQPNSLARGLRLNRTFTVGMLVPDLTNPLFPPIARGSEERLAEESFTLLVANTSDDIARERAILELIGRRRVDGLLLATADRSYPLLDELVDSGVPTVLVNRVTDAPRVSSVTGDEHAGIGLAVRHLVELGHTRIAYVGGTLSVSTGLMRYQAFLSWMQSEGLEADRDLIVLTGAFTQALGREACTELLDRDRPFTAIVAGNDLIALGCYAALGDRGLKVPDDVSVIGYNDIPFCESFAPPLTTIRIPHYEIGVRAAELILDAIHDAKRAHAVAHRLAPELVVRSSTAPPRA